MDFRSLALSLKRELDQEVGESPLGQPRTRVAAARQLLHYELIDIIEGRRRFQWVQAARLFGLVPRLAPGLVVSPPDLLNQIAEGLAANRSALVLASSRAVLNKALAKSPIKPMGSSAGQWAEALRPLAEEWEQRRNQRQEAHARSERLTRGRARLKEMQELRHWQVRVAEKAVALLPEVERLRGMVADLHTRMADLDGQAERARKAGSLGRWALGLRQDALGELRDQVSLELRMAVGALHIRETELQKLQDEALSRQHVLQGYESRFISEFECPPDAVQIEAQLQEAKDQARRMDAAVREAAVSMEEAQRSLLQGARLVALAFDEWPDSPVLLDLEYDIVALLEPESLPQAFQFLAAGLAKSQLIVMGTPPEPPPVPEKKRRRRRSGSAGPDPGPGSGTRPGKSLRGRVRLADGEGRRRVKASAGGEAVEGTA